MRIYLAGPMRGISFFNWSMFDKVSAALRAEGHEVFSPADEDRKLGIVPNEKGDEGILPEGITRRTIFSADTQYICNHADTIALLPGWEKSSGVRAEHALALTLGHTIMILGANYVGV
jgi:hypothetical protein